MAKSRKERGLKDKGRGFYETSSPFETYEPGAEKPKTWGGYTDQMPVVPAPRGAGTKVGGDATDIGGADAVELVRRMQPEQYDNPRGFPGLAMIHAGNQKAKLPMTSQHNIHHQMEGEGELARTGRGNNSK
jgi:hypothetical protein